LNTLGNPTHDNAGAFPSCERGGRGCIGGAVRFILAEEKTRIRLNEKRRAAF
jgi:hypothetical protein